LVKKLEGSRNKGRQLVISHLVPYPAKVTKSSNNVTIKLLDFDDLTVVSNSLSGAMSHAQNELLRRLMTLLRESDKIPQPDQYLETIDEQSIIMIDPLAVAA